MQKDRRSIRTEAPFSVVHQVLVEVDAKETADDLARGHPPSEEGEEAAKEEWCEDGAEAVEGLSEVGHGGLDLLLHILGFLIVLHPWDRRR